MRSAVAKAWWARAVVPNLASLLYVASVAGSPCGGADDAGWCGAEGVAHGEDGEALSLLQRRLDVSAGSAGLFAVSEAAAAADARRHQLEPGTSQRSRDEQLCSALRMAVSGAVLCGEECLSYRFDCFNPRCRALVPAFVATPATASEVQAVVRLAREHGMSFSVRGGGHSYVCNGFKKGSVHIDMRSMKQFRFHEDGEYGFAQMGPGLTNGDMQKLIPPGYQYAVGTCPTVGVVGFLVHGGSSPRTAWLGNTTLFSMDVVIANGTALSLSESSPHADLWQAMRSAGSSFGVVTSLMVRLRRKPQRSFAFIPTKNTFEEVLRALEPPQSSDDDPWVGVFRFDLVHPSLRGRWMLKMSLPGKPVAPQSTESVLSLVDRERAVGLQEALKRQEVDVALSQSSGMLRWMDDRGLEVDLDAALWHPEDSWQRLSPSDDVGDVNLRASATLGDHGHAQQRKASPVTDVGSTGRFYAHDRYKEAARLMHSFYVEHVDSCWFDLGPIKSDIGHTFLDTSCYKAEAVRSLRIYTDAHLQQLNNDSLRYYNLPLEGTPRATYWPNYHELAAIKARWDPTDFFNISDGIHPLPST